MTGRMLKVRPYQSFCTCCERNENSDWIEERERYECDACQRDWESEHAEECEASVTSDLRAGDATSAQRVESPQPAHVARIESQAAE